MNVKEVTDCFRATFEIGMASGKMQGDIILPEGFWVAEVGCQSNQAKRPEIPQGQLETRSGAVQCWCQQACWKAWSIQTLVKESQRCGEREQQARASNHDEVELH